MNVLLCMARTDLEIEATCPPLGMLSLAPVLKAAGHRVLRVVLPLDFPALVADLEHQLRGCDVLGVSATSYNWYVARRLVDEARRLRPELVIVLGGIHPSYLPEHCLRSSAADVVVRGEGEVTLPALLDALARRLPLDGVEGITFKDAAGRIHATPDRPRLTEDELDRLPLPAYELVPPHQYPCLPLEGSRGCLYSCAFCSILFPRSHRAVSPSRAAALIARLGALPDRFPGRGLFFTDDSFGTRGATTRAILGLLAPTGLLLGVEGRYNDLERHDLMAAMEPNRFYLIQVGVESGSQAGVDRVDKRLRIADLYEFADRVARRSFRRAVTYSMALGLPWETEEDVLRSIDFGCELAIRSGSQAPLLNNFNPLPGSRLLARPADFDMAPLAPERYDDGSWFRPFLGFTQIPPANREAIRSYRDWRLRTHPLLPLPGPRQLPDGRIVNLPVWNVGRDAAGVSGAKLIQVENEGS